MIRITPFASLARDVHAVCGCRFEAQASGAPLERVDRKSAADVIAAVTMILREALGRGEAPARIRKHAPAWITPRLDADMDGPSWKLLVRHRHGDHRRRRDRPAGEQLVTDITMPKLSDSMEEGTILSWLKEDGEQVQVGEDLVEIETDKATVTHQADAAGTITIVAEAGTSRPVGAVIARLGAAGAAAEAEAVTAQPVAVGEGATTSSGVEVPTSASGPVAANRNGDGTATATPVARRAAGHHGIDLATVQGTGALGRVTRADVLRAAGVEPEPAPAPVRRAATPAPAAAAVTPIEPASARDGVSRVEPTRLQQVIARRMAESKATVPHFQVQTEVAMDAAIELRAKLKTLAGDGEPVPSFNDIIIKAAAAALRDFPLANGSYKDAAFELHEAINVGMAVAADDALVVPTVFDADAKSLGQIARETRRLAGRVRDGEISPPELSGGTFTVSNLGMFGMTAITPVVNPPQAAILGVGAMRDVLARVDGEIVERRLLTLTLSCDHRILYGADAARFLSRIRELLEEPLRLAL